MVARAYEEAPRRAERPAPSPGSGRAVPFASSADAGRASPFAPPEPGRTSTFVFETRPRTVPEADAVRLQQRSTPMLQAPFGARAAPERPAAAPRVLTPEEELELALVDPIAFLRRFHAQRPPEAQEAWLAAVAEHAARRRTVEQVVRGLRASAGPEGHDLAARFEGAASAVAYPAEGR